MDTSKERGVTSDEGAATEIDSPEKGSGVAAIEVFPLSDDRDTNQEGTSTRTGRGSGGHKTHAGKQNSKNNALKHGIFSKAALLKGESPDQLNYLLSGLRNDFAPNGTL